MQRTIYSILLLIFIFSTGFTQTPDTLETAIIYDSDPNMSGIQNNYGVADIEGAFTNAHRLEEAQFCFSTNSINDWSMPVQADWDAMSIDVKFLFLMNEERKARGGLDYCNGFGPVKGSPFTGVEMNIDVLAQSYVDNLLMTGTKSLSAFADDVNADNRIGGTGCNLVQGIRNDCCHEHLPRAALSLRWPYNTAGSGIQTIEIEARTIYTWLYGNSNGTSAGSRETILLQDDDLEIRASDPFGFSDNYGDTGDEGFIGIGIASGPYNSTTGGTSYAHVDYVLLGYFDPIPESYGCSYNCTSCPACPNTISVNSIPFQDGVIQAQNTVTAQGFVPSSGYVTMKSEDCIELNPVFEVASGGIFHAYIDGCYFTLD